MELIGVVAKLAAQVAPPSGDAWSWAAGVLVLVSGSLSGLYVTALRLRAVECCRERDELRKVSDAALSSYRARDEEERRVWQEWQRHERERPQGSQGASQ